MNKRILLSITAFALAALLAVSCSSGPSGSNNEEGFNNMRVPNNFNYETTRDFEFVINSNSGSQPAVVSILTAHPSESGRVMKRVSLKSGSAETKVNIPTYLEEIWIASKFGADITQYQAVPLSGSRINVSVSKSALNSGTQTMNVPDPVSCTTGCTTTLGNMAGGSITINNGETVCVPEGVSLQGVTVTFNGGSSEFKACGNVSFQNVNVNGGAVSTIKIGETGVLSSQAINLNNTSAYLLNQGVLNYQSSVGLGYKLENMGILNAPGLNVNNGAEFINHNQANISGNFNNSNLFTNNGRLEVAGNFANNSNSLTVNNCTIIVSGDFDQNSTLDNNSYIEVTGRTTANGSTNTNFGPGGLLETTDLTVNGDINGPNSAYARINVALRTVINGGGSINNLMDICDAFGIDRNNGTIGSGVTYCDAFIPPSSCNPGAGDNSGSDSDGDGVPDDQDEYPDDPDRAFNNPYPAAGVFGTLAFEDLWPSLGDYDMNDLVLDYHINEVTNASNGIVDIEFIFVIRAIGAALESGFGVELPVPFGSVASVTGTRTPKGLVTLNGNGTEAGHSRAVIIMTDDSTENIGRFVNTQNPANHVQEDTIRVSVTFNSPVTREQLGTPPYKPFIFVKEDRTHEIHLPGMSPTALADLSRLGTRDDDSRPSQNRYFKSRNNLNWAINVPVSIPYPLESVDKTLAYPNFRNWAESGGSANPDWYLDLPGNRVENLLYIKPGSGDDE
ncbi:MAG: LruC domain-containing protein [Balneolales bacterium]|nr:LruC domain-containing protein [Balneolales bacterium]